MDSLHNHLVERLKEEGSADPEDPEIKKALDLVNKAYEETVQKERR